MKLSIKKFFSKCDKIQFPADLVTLTKKILNEKNHFLCNARDENYHKIRVLMIKLLQKKNCSLNSKTKAIIMTKTQEKLALKLNINISYRMI